MSPTAGSGAQAEIAESTDDASSQAQWEAPAESGTTVSATDGATDGTWVARFASGAVVACDAHGWSICPYDPEVTAALENGATYGHWPSIAGWPMPATPGFDPDWMYLRLIAIGAIDVQGPCPPCDVEDRTYRSPDDVVG